SCATRGPLAAGCPGRCRAARLEREGDPPKEPGCARAFAAWLRRTAADPRSETGARRRGPSVEAAPSSRADQSPGGRQGAAPSRGRRRRGSQGSSGTDRRPTAITRAGALPSMPSSRLNRLWADANRREPVGVAYLASDLLENVELISAEQLAQAGLLTRLEYL